MSEWRGGREEMDEMKEERNNKVFQDGLELG